jgi:methylisocitrate lyase
MGFREMLSENAAHLAPAVFNPLSAKLAEQAGFKMLYLGGGALGYVKCCLEANLNLTEIVQAGVEIRGVSALPLILDAACGFGDPMHMHHTIGLAEAAGFCAIEIEDQLIPKRAHHHIGIEHMIPRELMVAKVQEAVRARRNPDFVIIARTNAVRQTVWTMRSPEDSRIAKPAPTCSTLRRAIPTKHARSRKDCRRRSCFHTRAARIQAPG